MRRPLVVVLAVAVALAAGGLATWAWAAGAVQAGTAGRDRVALAVTAGRQDDRLAAGLSARSADVAGRDLLGGSRDALSRAIPRAQSALDASAGQVADDAVRRQLSDAVDAARAVGASAAPAVADEVLARLSAATAAVLGAQRAWQAGPPAPTP